MKIQSLIEDACMQDWRQRIMIYHKAMLTARSDFQLGREADVAGVISQLTSRDYSERPIVPLSAPIPGATIGTSVYSYNIYLDDCYGYLGFVRNTSDSIWIVKSFKNNREPDPREVSPFAQFKKSTGK